MKQHSFDHSLQQSFLHLSLFHPSLYLSFLHLRFRLAYMPTRSILARPRSLSFHSLQALPWHKASHPRHRYTFLTRQAEAEHGKRHGNILALQTQMVLALSVSQAFRQAPFPVPENPVIPEGKYQIILWCASPPRSPHGNTALTIRLLPQHIFSILALNLSRKPYAECVYNWLDPKCP